MKEPTKPINILLIRSATNTWNTTVKTLKNEFPDSKITVLAPESAKKILERDSNINSIISAGDINRMSILSLKSGVIKEMRSSAFDLAVSMYNIDHGMGYSNIDCLAWASGAKKFRGYNARGTFIEFNGWGALKKYFLEKTSFTWFIINVLTTVTLFVFITLGLLFEWAVRKVFSITCLKGHSLTKKKVALTQYTEPQNMHSLAPEVHQKT
jgi:ADP-heptose:LPS heptosyltransferase